MDNMQHVINGIAKEWQHERSLTQMTLGKLIKFLEKQDDDFMIAGLYEIHSYRGYYDDLALEPRKEKTSAKTLLKLCRDAMGVTFVGYKGGDFLMGDTTPLWIAFYGVTGKRLMGINPDGSLHIEEEND